MSTKVQASTNSTKKAPEKANIAEPKSLAIAERGVTNSAQFAALMSATIADVISGRMATEVANSAVNAGAKLLKVVEMEQRYGKSQPPVSERERPILQLARTED